MSSTSKSAPRRPVTSTTQRPTTKRVDRKSTRSPGSTSRSSDSTTSRSSGSTSGSPGSTTSRSPESTTSSESRQDESKKSTRQRSKAKGSYAVSSILEYKLDEMFPDMKLLLKRKQDWNFRDPDYIRAAFVESETGMMEHWKSQNAKIRSVQNTNIQFKSNLSNDLKMRHLLRKIEKERREKRHLRQILRNFRNPPTFPPVQIYTNSTHQLRQAFINNNPNVPAHVAQHFAKFRKPPFKTTKKEPHKVTWCG